MAAQIVTKVFQLSTLCCKNEINVVIANPKWVKAVKGNKDDTKDSKWIGDLFRLGLVKGSYIPCKAIRVLREYTRYRYKLVSCRSSQKNRYQNALSVCNIALDSVVSDIFGKSSTFIIDYLLEQPGTSINHEEIASKLLRSLKSKEDAVIESINGYQMTDAQKYRMRFVRAHMDYITAKINDVDSMIEKLIFLLLIVEMLSSYFVPFQVLNMIALSPSSPKLVLTWLSSQVTDVYAAGRPYAGQQ